MPCLRRPMLMELMHISGYFTILDGMKLKFMSRLCYFRYLGAFPEFQLDFNEIDYPTRGRSSIVKRKLVHIQSKWRSNSETLSSTPRRIMNDNPVRLTTTEFSGKHFYGRPKYVNYGHKDFICSLYNNQATRRTDAAAQSASTERVRRQLQREPLRRLSSRRRE